MPGQLINAPGAAVGKFNSVVQNVPGALLLPRSRASRKPPASTPNVVHDHTRLRQHQIAAIPCVGVQVRTRHMWHSGTTEDCEAVSPSSCGGELSPSGRSTETISDGCSDTDSNVLVKRVGENLLPTAQAWWLWWPGPPLAAPDAGNGHIQLFGHPHSRSGLGHEVPQFAG
jgi:hypothetical protein